MVIAVVSYERRNAIARDIANRALGDTELRVADAALDSLGPSRVRFSELTLETRRGMQIALFDLEVPLEFPSVTTDSVSVGRVQVSTGQADVSAPTALTPQVRTVLELPARLPAITISIGALQIDKWPVLRGVVMNVSPEHQRLAFRVERFSVSAKIEVNVGRGYQLDVNAATETEPEAATATATIEADAAETRVRGYIETDGETALLAGQLIDVIPDSLQALSGELVGMLDLVIDRDEPGRVAILAAAASEGELEITAFDREFRGSISTNSPVEFRTTWPGEDWELRAPRSNWFANIGGIEQVPIELSSASCNPGLHCELDVELGPASIALGSLAVDRLQATLPLAIDVDGSVTARLVTAPTWQLTGVTLGALKVGTVIGIGLDNAVAELSNGSLGGSAQRMSANLSNIVFADYALDALAISATDILYNAGTLTGSFRVPENSGRIAWQDYRVRLPGVEGELSAGDQQIDLAFAAQLNDDGGGLTGA
ncbi:MAG: hypothetical protein AAGA61_05880, partial [Pseudomonadota bacterium]